MLACHLTSPLSLAIKVQLAEIRPARADACQRVRAGHAVSLGIPLCQLAGSRLLTCQFRATIRTNLQSGMAYKFRQLRTAVRSARSRQRQNYSLQECRTYAARTRIQETLLQ